MRRSGEAPVGEQCDLVGQTGADNGSGHSQHFAHARSPLGTLVSDHDHIAFPDLSCLYGGKRVLFAVKDARRSSVVFPFLAAQLDHAAVGGETAAEYE